MGPREPTSHSLLAALKGCPLFYLLLGALPSVAFIRHCLTLDNFVPLLALFLLLLIGSAVVVLFFKSPAFLLILLGFAGFGLYAALLVYPYLLNSAWVIGEPRFFEGVLTQDGFFQVEKVDNYPFAGQLFMSAGELPGETVLTGPVRISLTGQPVWPEERQELHSYLRQNRLLGLIEVNNFHQFVPITAGPAEPIVRLRGYLTARYQEFSGDWPLSASLSEALLLGDSRAVPGKVTNLLRNLGISHLFVISGLHVAFIFFWLDWLIPGPDNWFRFILFSAIFSIYLLFLGWPTSAFRAVIMVLLFMLSKVLRRRVRGPVFLVAAAFLLLLLDPFLFFDTPFQLTFAATAGIFAVQPYLKLIPDFKLLKLFVYNTGAFLGVLPVVLYHFNYIPVRGLVASYLAGIFFPLFLLLLFFQNIFFWTGWGFFATLWETVFSSAVLFLIERIGWASYLTSVSGISIFTVLLLVGALWLVLDPGWRLEFRVCGFAAALLLLFVALLPAFKPHLEVRKLAGLSFTHLRSGRGESLLIIPRNLPLDNYSIQQLNRHLQNRGTRHLTVVISDYSRDGLLARGLDLPVKNFHTHRSAGSLALFFNFNYDFARHKLYLNSSKICYNNPSVLDNIQIAYDPQVILGYLDERLILVDQLEKIDQAYYQQLQAAGWKFHLLQEQPLLLNRAGKPVTEKQVKYSMETWLKRLFIGWPGRE